MLIGKEAGLPITWIPDRILVKPDALEGRRIVLVAVGMDNGRTLPIIWMPDEKDVKPEAPGNKVDMIVELGSAGLPMI